MLDIGRFVAIAAIVWLHTWMDYRPRVADAARFAVPFFTAAAMFLLMRSLRRKPQIPFGDFAARRFRRLYLPFLGWDVVYLISSDLKRRFVSHLPMSPLDAGLLWSGSSLQLWYLPFLLIASLAVFLPCQWIARRRSTMPPVEVRSIAAALTLIGLVVAVCPVPWAWTTPPNTTLNSIRVLVVLSWQTLPALFWGLALAIVDLPTGNARSLMAAVGLILLFATEASIVNGRNTLLENLAGIGAMGIALLPWDSAAIRRAATAGGIAYGIYLAHVLFIEAMFALAPRAHISNSVPLKIIEFFAAIVLSVALVWSLNRSKWTRWMTGG